MLGVSKRNCFQSTQNKNWKRPFEFLLSWRGVGKKNVKIIISSLFTLGLSNRRLNVGTTIRFVISSNKAGNNRQTAVKKEKQKHLN